MTAILPFVAYALLCADKSGATERTNAENMCPTTNNVFRSPDDRPKILSGRALMTRVVSCSGPRLPALARQVRLQGYVRVLILVDEAGHVACAHAINGHPLIIGSALEAVREWAFRPVADHGRSVSFYGIVAFHFSTSQTAPQSCLDARW